MTTPADIRTRACTGCGRPVSDTGAFCGNCGTALTPVPAPAPAAAAAARRHVTPPARLSPPAAYAAPVSMLAVPVPAAQRAHSPALLATLAVLIVIAFTGAAAAIILAVSGSDNGSIAGSATTTTVTVLTHARS